MFLKRSALLALSGAALLPALAVHADEVVKMKLMSHGLSEKLGNLPPQLLQLSAIKPANVTKVPTGVKAPLYGVLKLGDPANPTKIAVLVDEQNGKKSRLFVDSNGDGDLTNDAAPEWEARPYTETNKGYFGGAIIRIKTSAGNIKVGLTMYRFDKNDEDPRRKKLADKLIYFGDYAYEGSIQLGDKTYKAMLLDVKTRGDFRVRKGVTGQDASGVQLLIDVNENGKYDSTGEMFDIAKPFNIAGTTYEIKNISTVGDSFTVAKSDKTVAEILPPPNLTAGKPSLMFEAKTMDGKTVKFPDDYKGKVVMLDFWATWCPPCRAEIPGIVKNYNTYHSQNFEILGVSLDKADVTDTVTSFTKTAGMTWTEVYDGKYWKAEVAQKYGIESIPHAFLVDGDTGEIIAEGDALRGESLEGTLKSALEKKNAKK